MKCSLAHILSFSVSQSLAKASEESNRRKKMAKLDLSNMNLTDLDDIPVDHGEEVRYLHLEKNEFTVLPLRYG